MSELEQAKKYYKAGFFLCLAVVFFIASKISLDSMWIDLILFLMSVPLFLVWLLLSWKNSLWLVLFYKRRAILKEYKLSATWLVVPLLVGASSGYLLWTLPIFDGRRAVYAGLAIGVLSIGVIVFVHALNLEEAEK